MSWTRERKAEALMRAPYGRDLLREDTQVIERPGWYQLITPSTRGWVLNEVMRSRLSDGDAERTIDEVIAQYRALGLPVKWYVGPWTEPADFGERLERRGFQAWPMRGMSFDAALRLGPSDARIELVTESNLDRYIEAFLRGWQIDAEQAAPTKKQFVEALRAKPRTAYFFLATVDGEAAGTSGLLLRDRHGYFVGAQVLDGFRGRGLYRALIEKRLALLRERGDTLAVTMARGSTSAPMLEHLGFETLFDCWLYFLER